MDPSVPGAAATALLSAMADGARHEICGLADALGLSRRQISDAAAKLARRGMVARTSPGKYRLTEAGLDAHATGKTITSGPKGPTNARHILRDTFRERAWRAMRVRKTFTIGEIVADANRSEDETAARDNARRYISALKSAGYVGELARRVPGTAPGSNGFKRFVLMHNTGPRAPVFRASVNALHDPNTGEDVPCVTP